MLRSALVAAFLIVLAHTPVWGNEPSDGTNEVLLRAVVKVVSQLRGSDTVFNGTGLIFTSRERVYVVTSDHVVLHSNDLAEHWIYRPGQAAKIGCRLVRASFATGLALLRCDGQSTAGLIRYDGYPDSRTFGRVIIGSHTVETDRWYFNSKTIERIDIAGYSSDSFSLRREINGRAHLVRIESHPLLLDVDVMLRTDYVKAEFGMSGGVLFEPARYQGSATIHGMLTHHRVTESGKMSVYALPMMFVRQFIFQTLQYEDQYADGVWQDPIHQEIRHQTRGLWDAQVRDLDFQMIEVAGTERRLLRVRKAKRKVDHRRENEHPYPFDTAIESLQSIRPDCEIYLLAYRDLNHRWTPVSHPILLYREILEGAPFTKTAYRCPNTNELLSELIKLQPLYERFFEKVKPESNAITQFASIFLTKLRAFQQLPELERQFFNFDFGERAEKFEAHLLAPARTQEEFYERGFANEVLARENASHWAELRRLGVENELRELLKRTAKILRDLTP